MRDASDVSTPQEVKHIGIILADMGKVNVQVLKFLVLHMNTLQQTFEFEFLPTYEDEFLQKLSKQTSVDRNEIKGAVPLFLDRYQKYLQEEVAVYRIKDMELPTDHLILLSMACFNDNYYTTRKNGLAILALGNWEASMAPPSLIEFIYTLILRESVTFISSSLSGSVHLGTKGCLCDFTAPLSEVRLKVLNGFVCSYCRAALQSDGFAILADELVHILGKDWIGTSTDPRTPAGIAANLGYDLFITKGLKASKWEIMLTLLQQEGVKQLISIVGAVLQFILIALLILWLGLKR